MFGGHTFPLGGLARVFCGHTFPLGGPVRVFRGHTFPRSLGPEAGRRSVAGLQGLVGPWWEPCRHARRPRDPSHRPDCPGPQTRHFGRLPRGVGRTRVVRRQSRCWAVGSRDTGGRPAIHSPTSNASDRRDICVGTCHAYPTEVVSGHREPRASPTPSPPTRWKLFAGVVNRLAFASREGTENRSSSSFPIPPERGGRGG